MLGTINVTAEYALLATFYLALREPKEGNRKIVITVDEIARETGIPLPFLAKIMIQLTQKKLVRSSRGRKGGYLLARESHAISLLDVVQSMDHGKGCNQCYKGTEFCPIASSCPFFSVWQEVYESIESILKKYTLHSLVVCIKNMPEEGKFLEGLKKHLTRKCDLKF